MIKGLHHAAFRCRNSEETRAFYEEFLGLTLAGALEIKETKTAFFEAPDQPFEFIKQHDYDLHLALEVTQTHLHEMFEKGQKENVPTRGISDHGFISSIYFRDPNGYVVELTAKNDDHDDHLQPNNQTARNLLGDWTERFHAEDSLS